MKKITDYIVGHIIYVTDLNYPYRVFATFIRIINYFVSLTMIIQTHFVPGFSLLGVTIALTLFMFFTYLEHLDREGLQDCLEDAKAEYRQLKSEEREEIIASFKDLPKEEQIKVLETYIEVCKETKSEAEMLLEQIKHEDKS